MKKCPFCAEEIQDDAIKCRFCNEFLSEKKKEPWFFKPSVIIIGFLAVGPLVLPLVWLHPQYSLLKKIIATVIIIVLTVILGIIFTQAFQSMKSTYDEVFALLKST